MIAFKKNEEVILTKRRHWITIFLTVFPLSLVVFSSVIFFFLIAFGVIDVSGMEFLELFDFLEIENIKTLILIGLLLIIFVLWQVVYVLFLMYYLDSWVITSKRTIHTEISGVLHKKVSTVPNIKVQDVTVEQTGLLAHIFNFGNLHMQTAGAFIEFKFLNIPNPVETKETLLRAKKRMFKRSK